MSDPITQAAIQARAYQLWEEGGCVDGNDEEHWRRAEAECAAAGNGAAIADGAPTPSGMEEGGSDAAMPSGIDGEVSSPPVEMRSKPRRWPTPIVDV